MMKSAKAFVTGCGVVPGLDEDGDGVLGTVALEEIVDEGTESGGTAYQVGNGVSRLAGLFPKLTLGENQRISRPLPMNW